MKPLAILSLIALTACVPSDDAQCDFGCVIADKWVSEGDGLISQTARGFDDTGTSSFDYQLVRCGSGVAMNVGDYWSWSNGNQNGPNKLEAKIAELRTRSGLTDTRKFISALKHDGFEPRITQLHPDELTVLKACKKVYPEIERKWPEKTAEQIAKEAEVNSPENLRRIEEAISGNLKPAPSN